MIAEDVVLERLGHGSNTPCGFFPPFSFDFMFRVALLLGVAVMSIARALQRK